MALAALIAAYGEIGGGDALRATLPIAGHALIEHQVRQAVQAGAHMIVLVVERVPAPLTAAIDRLRRSGITIEIARGVGDAADRIHPDERLLVIADGLIADQLLVERIAGGGVPTIVTVADEPDHRGFERIDAVSRWGGLLLIDGARLRKTAAMLGDWDLQSTLLRRTVQEEPRRIEATAGLSLVDSTDAVEAVRETLVLATRGRARGWPARLLYAPLEELALPPLARLGIDPVLVRAAAIAMTLIAALAMLLDWRLGGLIILLIASPIDALARRLARLRLQMLVRLDPTGLARTAAGLLALAAIAASLARVAGWGCWALAGATAAAMAALAGELAIGQVRPGLAARRPLWIADEDALPILLLPFALAGRWVEGLLALAFYAAASFFRIQSLARIGAKGEAAP